MSNKFRFDTKDYEFNKSSKLGVYIIHGFSSTTYETKQLAEFLGNNGFSRFNAVWMETTPPTKKEMKETIPNDPIIRTSISLNIRFFNIFHFVNFPKTFRSIIK